MALAEPVLLAVLEHLPAAVLVADHDHRTVFANAHAIATLGHASVDVRRPPADAFLQIMDADGSSLAPSQQPSARALRGETVRATDYRYRRPDGVEVWLRAAASPVVHGHRCLGVVRRVDDEIAAAAKLRTAERRLEMAMGAGRFGAWTLDLETGRMSCTAGCKANFGLPPDVPFDYPDLLAAIHPDTGSGCGRRSRMPG